ncbi:MAG: Abi family protein [Lautropia sp.]|nr:Abi family protein [Lautropia sp.]
MRYNKPALSIDDQVQRLRERGMAFSDDQQAKVSHYLTHIGYYRLSAYWLPFEQPPPSGQPRNHQFRPGTTFEAVLSLYIFDLRLRLLMMEALDRIEIAVRTSWATALAMQHGPHAHLNPDLFECAKKHEKDIAKMQNDLAKSHETFVDHYRRHYQEPPLPPIWAVVETLSFGSLSYWFQATKTSDAKKAVQRNLAMPKIKVTEKVLHALTTVRNVCAHHGRLWNRHFTFKLPRIDRLGMQITDHPTAGKGTNPQQHPSPKLYNYLLVIAHMMNHINPGSSWKTRLQSLVNTRSEQELKAMGFPCDWESHPVWDLVKAPR